MSLRLARSPVAPKITSTQASPRGTPLLVTRTTGVASMMADMCASLFAQQTVPIGVNEGAVGVVGALIGVRSEEIALRLRKVLRQAGAAIAVEVSQRSGKCRHRHSHFQRGAYHAAPGGLGRVDAAEKIVVQHQISQLGLLVEGAHDVIQKERANDAAA